MAHRQTTAISFPEALRESSVLWRQVSSVFDQTSFAPRFLDVDWVEEFQRTEVIISYSGYGSRGDHCLTEDRIRRHVQGFLPASRSLVMICVSQHNS